MHEKNLQLLGCIWCVLIFRSSHSIKDSAVNLGSMCFSACLSPIPSVGGGFKHLCSPLGRCSNLTNVFNWVETTTQLMKETTLQLENHASDAQNHQNHGRPFYVRFCITWYLPSLKLTFSHLKIVFFQVRNLRDSRGLFSGATCMLVSGRVWVFPKIMVPQNGRFIMENPIKMDDLGGQNTPIFGSPPISSIIIKYPP